MNRVLIANRGEIAVRVLRACKRVGIEAVMVYSRADRDMPYLRDADRAICIGPPAATHSYLSQNAILTAALGTGCDAVHPGYGFLAENADFAERCAQQGLTFIGPSPQAIRLMGDKIAGREAAQRYGVPLVPGSQLDISDPKIAREEAERVGFPLLIKASAGGGGRGMRVVTDATDLESQVEQARAEALAAFSNPSVYLERFFAKVHHVEVQVFGDSHGNAVQLGERDCSTQRRHQKLVEESPSPVLDDELRSAMCETALNLTRTMGYTSAGTIEFIFDPRERKFYFIEMNTRIQVEHPVTEVVTGADLVAEQLRVAAGEALALPSRPPSGHAIEWRINAEDPARNFLPTPGTISRFRVPQGEGIRVDTFVEEGHVLSPYYDSLLAKLIVHGSDRAQALARSATALAQFEVQGVSTTLPFHRHLVEHEHFITNQVHTRWVEENLAELGQHN
jgi:acetyl-CoA carboxylase biotin carboxylase subunit